MDGDIAAYRLCHAGMGGIQRPQQLGHVRHGDLGGVGGRGGPPVRYEVADGHVRLVAYRRDDRNIRVVDGSGHALVVKGPQVLQRTAAAAGDEHIGQAAGIGVTDGAGDLRRGLSSLHANGQQKDLGDGIAAAEDADHVVDRRTCRGGDDGDAPGIWRQGLFMAFVKQALLPQLFLQLLKGHTQVAGALGRQAGTVQLVGAVAGIDADTAGGDDLHTVFRAEAQAHGTAPEHNTLQTALAVLQRKVVMAGGV